MKDKEKCIHYWVTSSHWKVLNDIVVRRRCKVCGRTEDGSFNVTNIKDWEKTKEISLSN